MAEVRLSLDTLNEGTLFEDFDGALARVSESFEHDGDLGGARQITIKISFKPEGKRLIKTEHTVETKLPARGRSGMAWTAEGGSLKTESLCREGDGNQMDIVKFAEERAKRGRSKRED